ncbi:MAG: hypothetical protein ABSG21_10045 [Spirochaetia bacterium]
MTLIQASHSPERLSGGHHETGRTILELMMEMNRSAGSTLVFATHDPAVARHAGGSSP